MKSEDSHRTTIMAKSTLKLLASYIPNNTQLSYLEDIFFLLFDSLSRGDLFVHLDNQTSTHTLKNKGWPIDHINALLETDLTKGENSPIAINDNYISWRRWNNELKEVIQLLLNKTKLFSASSNSFQINEKVLDIVSVNKEQLLAIKKIIQCGLVLMSGGPGTGKTMTIIHMVNQVLCNDPLAKITLSAPTGKATRRLQESLQANISTSISSSKERLLNIPCITLHSLLQARPGGFGKNQKSLLDLDLLVIDEMSMVNLALMQAVLNALPNKCKLILVGDPDQLPPISTGAIWQELQKPRTIDKFDDSAIHLRKLYRNRGAIAELSTVIRDEGLEAFWTTLSTLDSSSNVQLIRSKLNVLPKKVISIMKQQKQELETLTRQFKKDISYETEFSNIQKTQPIELSNKVFRCLDRLIVLCPQKNGLWGVRDIHQKLLGNSLLEGLMSWPEGTPVICSTNQPELGLSNGDIGIIIGNSETRRILFRVFTIEQKLVSSIVHPARIKKLEPAFALTIHKAQGSEANNVILMWPETISDSNAKSIAPTKDESYNQKLLYTAITRAKQNLIINITYFDAFKDKNSQI
ncbi:ATP-dependent DNA helicase [Prochlorococcus sp. MIT 1223]|uniref:ATP-dependent DNA helicase n=1 Tax=Prochlorococcus sp. MIT 1223 TaxID=3096217 RepID=UPI002A764D0E|nr:AAA family ATPase [Prochlorococcus sp. MIT 1223]